MAISQEVAWNPGRVAIIAGALAFAVAALIPSIAGNAGAQVIKFGAPLFGFIATFYFVRAGKAASALSCILWLFFVTPLIRRLVDNQIGFDAANPVSLTPIIGSLPIIPSSVAYLLDKTEPYRFRFAILMFAVVYGSFLGTLQGNAVGAIFEGLRWLVPPALCLYVLRNSQRRGDLASAFLSSFRIALPLLSAYGVFQFFVVPEWDRVWMIGADLNSIGKPEPYEIRIFSALNSPGSLGFFLVVALLSTIIARTKFSVFGAMLGLVALALTLDRSAWIGLVFGLSIYMTKAGTKERISALVLIFAGIVFVILSMRFEPIHHLLSDRFSSLSNIGQDASVSDRWQNFSQGVSSAAELLLGQGFGSVNQPGQTLVIDGGLVAAQYELGLFGGVLYVTALLSCIGSSAVVSAMCRGPLDGLLLALTLVFALELLSATAQAGEIGVFFWVPVGLAMAKRAGASATGKAVRDAA